MIAKVLPLVVLIHTTMGLNVGIFLPWNLTSEKVETEYLADRMLRVMERYDLLAVHGYGDAVALRSLFRKLQERTCHYEMKDTPALMKVGFLFPDANAFIYKKNLMTLGNLVRDQPTGAIYGKVTLYNGYEFIFMAAHSASDRAVDEANLLVRAYDRAVSNTHIEDVLIAASVSTGEPFMTEAEYNNLELTKNDTFQWYLNYGDDNIALPDLHTASQRFIGTNRINDLLMEQSAAILNITDYFGLSLADTLDIGFNLPIEIEMAEGSPMEP